MDVELNSTFLLPDTLAEGLKEVLKALKEPLSSSTAPMYEVQHLRISNDS